MSELEQEEHQDLIREMNQAVLSGMLLCLNCEQRDLHHREYSEATTTSGRDHADQADNYRAKLKKARRDLYNFNQKCGLVNKGNPCRCHKKVSQPWNKGD